MKKVTLVSLLAGAAVILAGCGAKYRVHHHRPYHKKPARVMVMPKRSNYHGGSPHYQRESKPEIHQGHHRRYTITRPGLRFKLKGPSFRHGRAYHLRRQDQQGDRPKPKTKPHREKQKPQKRDEFFIFSSFLFFQKLCFLNLLLLLLALLMEK